MIARHDTSMADKPVHQQGVAAGPLLFASVRLRGITLRNRVVVSPMCQYMSTNGIPADWQLVNFGRYAMGGAGVVFGEETAIEAGGRKTYDCAGLWDDAQIPAYRRITDFIKEYGAVPAIQLGHAGGKASCHGARYDWQPLTPENCLPGQPPWEAVAPSARPERAWPRTRALSVRGIRQHLARWREATLRAVDAGYQILEIHGAHGYLLHQFLSPVTNRRQDAYGGDRAGRMRLALEVTEIVRANWPGEYPLFFRVSAVDGKGGLWDLDDTVALARALKERGVDVVDCSSGGITGDSAMPIVRRVPGYQTGFSATVRQRAGIKTMAVGLITRAQQAEAILQKNQADLVALARELIWNPNWPAHAARELGDDQAAFALLPPEHEHRLARRELVARLPVNRQGTPPSGEENRLVEST